MVWLGSCPLTNSVLRFPWKINLINFIYSFIRIINWWAQAIARTSPRWNAPSITQTSPMPSSSRSTTREWSKQSWEYRKKNTILGRTLSARKILARVTFSFPWSTISLPKVSVVLVAPLTYFYHLFSCNLRISPTFWPKRSIIGREARANSRNKNSGIFSMLSWTPKWAQDLQTLKLAISDPKIFSSTTKVR